MFHKMMLTVVGLLVLGTCTDVFADYVLTGSYPNGDTYTDVYVTAADGTIRYKERTTKRNGKPISKVRFYWVLDANGHFGWNNPMDLPLPNAPAAAAPAKGAACPPVVPTPKSNQVSTPNFRPPVSPRPQPLLPAGPPKKR